VITEDGQSADPDLDNVWLWVNRPGASDGNTVYVRPGAFWNGSIAPEDIDWSTFDDI
jgi:hypothetical protein